MTRSLNICIFSTLYEPSLGGVEIYTKQLARELIRQGHSVTVVTSNTHGLPSRISDEGVEIVRLPCQPLMGARLPLPMHNAEQKTLLEELKQQHFDGIMVNSRFYPHSLLGLNVAKEVRVKPILLDHGSAYITLGNPLIDQVLKAYEHFMTTRVKKHDVDYYAVSEAGIQWLRNFDIEGKGTLNNAIDAQAFVEGASDRNFREECSLDDKAFLVAFTGRLVPEKGIRELVEAAALLRGRDIHILLAGDGPLLEDVQNASENIHALGRIPREDIAALLLQSDAFCMPTRSEGFSTSLLEAAACGCTPIITDVGGVAELIPDESYGVVLPNTKPKTIAAAISSLADDRDRCERISSNVRKRVADLFTWERTAQRVVEACERANAFDSQ